jgi:hypothetical protein
MVGTPTNLFCIFMQQEYSLHFLRHAAQSPFHVPQFAVYVIILHFPVQKILTLLTQHALKFKIFTPNFKGLKACSILRPPKTTERT